MKWLKAIAFLFTGMLVGLVLGVYGCFKFTQMELDATTVPKMKLSTYNRILNLTPSQSNRIGSLLKARYEAERQSYITDADLRNHLRHQAAQEIRALLTPQQLTEFDRLTESEERHLRHVRAFVEQDHSRDRDNSCLGGTR